MKLLTPQEVRLGNLTSHGVVVGIFNNSFDVESQTGEWYSLHDCDIYPVLLTHEILEGFGFQKDDGLLCLEINKNTLEYATAHPENGVGLYSFYGDGILFPEMKHAHTLQNFIQSISGVELVYKQNKTE